MSIVELTAKVKASAKTRSPDQRIKLLKAARILDSKGNLDHQYFTDSKSASTKSS
ncbi:MAG: hypothetical protein ACPGYX_03590 [Oceanobacter sp.]